MPKTKEYKEYQEYSISGLRTLLTYGEVEREKLSSNPFVAEKLHLSKSVDGKRYVANSFLLELISKVSNQKDVLATIINVLGAQSTNTKYVNVFSKNVDSWNAAANQNWWEGRLLLLPRTPRNKAHSESSVLCGTWKSLPDTVPALTQEEAINWVLSSPWAFLLAQLVFTQAAWSEEKKPYFLSLELAKDCTQYFENPIKINVRLTQPNNIPVLCGSLAELLLKVLDRLEVSLFPHKLPAKQLDLKFQFLITQLLKHKIWHFFDGKYSIDPGFYQFCSKVRMQGFTNGGIVIANAIRDVSERWATEKLPRISFKHSSYKF